MNTSKLQKELQEFSCMPRTTKNIPFRKQVSKQFQILFAFNFLAILDLSTSQMLQILYT